VYQRLVVADRTFLEHLGTMGTVGYNGYCWVPVANMALDLYHRLSRKSQAALVRTKKKFGRKYFYNPRFPLLDRLSKETGLSLGEVALKLMEEREELLQVYRAFDSQIID